MLEPTVWLMMSSKCISSKDTLIKPLTYLDLYLNSVWYSTTFFKTATLSQKIQLSVRLCCVRVFVIVLSTSYAHCNTTENTSDLKARWLFRTWHRSKMWDRTSWQRVLYIFFILLSSFGKVLILKHEVKLPQWCRSRPTIKLFDLF